MPRNVFMQQSHFKLGNTQMGQLGAIYKYDDYLSPASVSSEDRTGSELLAVAGWFYFFHNNEGFVNLRYTFNRDWAKGANWSFSGNKISAGILYPFLKKFRVGLNGEIFFQNFDNVHTVYGKKRKDQTYAAGPFLSYEILKDMELQVRYTYINEQSSLSIYEYDRHIVSTGVQYKF